MKKLSLSAVILLCLSLFAFAAKDPADYPVKVHILEQNWASHNLYRSEFRATGRGNIWEGDSIHAFDFKYSCFVGLRRTARNQPFLAKWKKPQLRLTLLVEQIGKSDKYQECELETSVHDGVYMLGPGGISEMSQQDFKTFRTRRQPARPGQQGGTAAPNAISKLSVSSTPDGAEIEIDGEFMGNTPSVLELDPGEHSISVHKAGYKAWEKKLKSTAGEVSLKAELTPE